MIRRQVPPRPALLITGGSGFVGQARVRELLRDNPVIDASEIRIFDIHSPTFLSADPMVDWGTHKPQTVYDINTDATAGALKASQEAGVSAASGQSRMRTVSLRPLSVWGEADPYHISALVNLAKSVPYVRIVDGSAVQQLVYVGNLAHAHSAACREILDTAADGRESACSGKSLDPPEGNAQCRNPGGNPRLAYPADGKLEPESESFCSELHLQ